MLKPTEPEAARLDPAKLPALRRRDGIPRIAGPRACGSKAGARLGARLVGSGLWPHRQGQPQRHRRRLSGRGRRLLAASGRIFRGRSGLALPSRSAHAEADQICRTRRGWCKSSARRRSRWRTTASASSCPACSARPSPRWLAGIGDRAHHSRAPKGERILGAFDMTLAAGLLHAHGERMRRAVSSRSSPNGSRSANPAATMTRSMPWPAPSWPSPRASGLFRARRVTTALGAPRPDPHGGYRLHAVTGAPPPLRFQPALNTKEYDHEARRLGAIAFALAARTCMRRPPGHRRNAAGDLCALCRDDRNLRRRFGETLRFRAEEQPRLRSSNSSPMRTAAGRS